MDFVNRTLELSAIADDMRKSNLVVLMGRRRVGKSRLIQEWGQKSDYVFAYAQAIESATPIQLEQLWVDLQASLPSESKNTPPRTWEQLFAVLTALPPQPTAIVIDEFPFLAQGDPSLPSRLQKWLDHDCPKHVHLCLLGSSQTLMKGLFSAPTAPLYMRARRILRVQPLAYRHFCEYLRKDPLEPEHFTLFALVGGVPKYWQLLDPAWDLLTAAEKLFFSELSYFENEKLRILQDEQIDSIRMQSLLDAVGRGARKPVDIARVLAVKPADLQKPLALLEESGLLQQEQPFEQSTRNNKNVLYTLADPFLAFHYHVWTPHHSRWPRYTAAEKHKLLHDHAAQVFEQALRKLWGGSRFYTQDLELDCVHYTSSSAIQVTEMKYRSVSTAEKNRLAKAMQHKTTQLRPAPSWLSAVQAWEVCDVYQGLAALAAEE